MSALFGHRRGIALQRKVFGTHKNRHAERINGPVEGYTQNVSNHRGSLSQHEQSLIGVAHPEALARMDEKALKSLQSKLWQAREKYFATPRHRVAARPVGANVRIAGAPVTAQHLADGHPERLEMVDSAWALVTQRLEASRKVS